ncbi:MAG: hypothetical protein M2R45_02756 [Verrucomicrobia subdivision 3 bacterium]|nr:hypothetical protein [Limisphaerales bacterium]MCS1414305.1 hypothetical protein [Limisphaerales bacterium]
MADLAEVALSVEEAFQGIRCEDRCFRFGIGVSKCPRVVKRDPLPEVMSAGYMP